MIKKIINWTPENRQILEDMYNDDKSDAEISAHFGNNVGVYAVAKQRSILGFVKVKMKKGIRRQPKTVYIPDESYIVLHSVCKDGHDHFARLNYNPLDNVAVNNITNKMLNKNANIRSITILQPTMVVSRVNVEQLL